MSQKKANENSKLCLLFLLVCLLIHATFNIQAMQSDCQVDTPNNNTRTLPVQISEHLPDDQIIQSPDSEETQHGSRNNNRELNPYKEYSTASKVLKLSLATLLPLSSTGRIIAYVYTGNSPNTAEEHAQLVLISILGLSTGLFNLTAILLIPNNWTPSCCHKTVLDLDKDNIIIDRADTNSDQLTHNGEPLDCASRLEQDSIQKSIGAGRTYKRGVNKKKCTIKYTGIAIASIAIITGATIDTHRIFLEAEDKQLGNIAYVLASCEGLSLFATSLVLYRLTSETTILCKKLPKIIKAGCFVSVLISSISYIGCEMATYPVVFYDHVFINHLVKVLLMSGHLILELSAEYLTWTTLASLGYNTIKHKCCNKKKYLINEHSVSNIGLPYLEHTDINAQETNGLDTQYTDHRLVKNLCDSMTKVVDKTTGVILPITASIAMLLYQFAISNEIQNNLNDQYLCNRTYWVNGSSFDHNELNHTISYSPPYNGWWTSISLEQTDNDPTAYCSIDNKYPAFHQYLYCLAYVNTATSIFTAAKAALFIKEWGKTKQCLHFVFGMPKAYLIGICNSKNKVQQDIKKKTRWFSCLHFWKRAR